MYYLTSKDKLLISLMVILFAGGIAFVIWNDQAREDNFHVGQSFELHEQLYFALNTPTRNIPFTQWQIESTLYSYKIQLPTGITISNLRVGASSLPSHTVATVDGIVTISSNVIPGRQVIGMDLPGLFGVARSANRQLTFSIGTPSFDTSNAWIVKSFGVRRD